MCNPTAIFIAGAGMKASSNIAKGITDKGNANLQAADLEYQAAVERDNAAAEAAAIRRDGQRARGETVTAIAASGVKLGDGSAADAERQVMQDANTDERLALLRGDQEGRQLYARAQNVRRAGRQALRAGYLNAASSLIDSYDKYTQAAGQRFTFKGWDARGYTGTNDRSLMSFGNNLDWWARNGSGGD